MWQEFPLFPESASSMSGEVDALYAFLVAVTIAFSALIAALLLVLSIRYRRRRATERGAAIEGSVPLEVVWTAVPLGLTMIMFAWGAKLYVDMKKMPADAMDVYVTGKQWMWRAQHPQGQREINDLHVPVGQTIRLTMSSEDVIHSYFIPAFRMKQDVVPGHTTQAWFEATKTGEYHLFCAEYCGTKHAEMIGTIHVMEPDEYEQWLTGVPTGETPVAAGERLFSEQRCDTCHNRDSGARGPWLAGRFGSEARPEVGRTAVFDEDYVRESILEPAAKLSAGYQAIMPTYAGQLSEEQLLQLTAYLRSLDGEERP